MKRNSQFQLIDSDRFDLSDAGQPSEFPAQWGNDKCRAIPRESSQLSKQDKERFEGSRRMLLCNARHEWSKLNDSRGSTPQRYLRAWTTTRIKTLQIKDTRTAVKTCTIGKRSVNLFGNGVTKLDYSRRRCLRSFTNFVNNCIQMDWRTWSRNK